MKKLLLLPLFAACTVAAQAQSEPSSGLHIELAAGATMTTLNTQAFNDAIPSVWPSLHNGATFAVTGSFNIVETGSPLHTNINMTSALWKRENAGVRLEEQLVLADVNVVYDFLLQRDQSLTAALGVGQGSYQASYFSDQPNTSFSAATALPVGERSFRLKPLYYINVKGGYGHRLFNGPFSLGIELGYRIGLMKRDWQLYDNALSGAPQQSISGFYASLMLTVFDQYSIRRHRKK